MSPVQERRSRIDRRSGLERRAEPRRTEQGQRPANQPIWVCNSAGSDLPLGQVFPHVQFNQRETTDRAVAIEAHRRELSAQLGRNVGLPVAGLDYLMNVSRDLVAPAIVEHDVLAVLEHRSVTDPLTGLFNRYHFEATIKREVARCLRYPSQLALLLIDVDQLKAVNDRWGHVAGDRVLGRVASALQRSLRSPDIPSRYGGDEFAIILPGTDTEAARLVAERICRNVAASLAEATARDAALAVTVSVGLAALSLAGTAASEAELIVAADQALYLAKDRGGNCVAEGVLPCRG